MTLIFGISVIGWIHTITGSIAIVLGLHILWQYKIISSKLTSGKIYIILTALSAATSLLIFNKGGFNLAHLLGIITIVALLVGYICERKDFFGLSSYVQAASYSSTLLFSLIPGMSEIFTRLPAENPLADSIFDPILEKTFLFLTFLFFCLITYQSYWIRFKSKAWF